MRNGSDKSGTKAFVLMISKVITLLLSILTSMVLARSLSLDEYGTYSELLTVSSIGVSVFSLGLPNALNYFLPRSASPTEKRNFIGFYFLAITVLSVLLMGAMAVANRPIAAYFDNEKLVSYSYFLIVIPWTKLIISSRSNLLVAEGKVIREIVYCIANGALLAAIALMTRLDQCNFDRYLIAYLVVEVLFALLVYIDAFILSDKQIGFRINKQTAWELLKYTIPLGLSTAISTISIDLDKLIIGYSMEESFVAVYANAGKELPFSLISTSFTAVFLPQIVLYIRDGHIKSALMRWKQIMEINFILLAFCVAGSIVFAPQIISLLYSEEYLAGVGIFRIYSFTLLLRITYWAMILNAFGKTKEILYNSLMCLALNVLLSVVLCRIIGFAGPALATLLSILFLSVLQVVRTSKMLQVSGWAMIPFRGFLLPTVISIFTGALMFLITGAVHMGTDARGIVLAVLLGLAWAVVYLGLFAKKILSLWKNLNHAITDYE